MEKIKKIFLKGISNLKENGKEYKGTYFILFIITILLMIMVDNSFIKKALGYDIVGKVLVFGFVSTITNFFIEITFKENLKKNIGYFISLLLGVAFAILCYWDNNTDIQNIAIRVLIGYLVAMLAVSLFIRIKKQKVEVNTYFLNIFQSLFYTGIIYFILNVGFILILAIFISLLWNSNGWWLLGKIEIALIGFYLIPSFLIAATREKVEITKFAHNLIYYVLLPLVTITMVIIYIYMAKIFILWQIPSNSIFRILTGLFIVAFPIWVMVYRKEDKSLKNKIAKILPWAFLPFLFLQAYSIGTRCIQYGMTPLRYLCIMFLLLEIIAVLLSIYQKRAKLEYVLIGVAILTIIATMTPFNLIAVSNRSQANRLAEAWKQGKNYEELSEEEKEQAQNAYFYLRNQEHVEKYIPTYLTKEDLEKLYPYTSVKKENTKFIYYYAKEINQKQDWIDISNYSKIKKIQVYDSDVSASEDLQYKAILEQIIAQYEITKETGEEYLRYNISCNQEEDIRINNLYIEYEIENGEIQIKDYTIEGYLLKK